MRSLGLAALLAVTSVVSIARAHPGQVVTVRTDPPLSDFILVSGPGYEGAIVPATSLFHRMGEITLRREEVAGVTVTPWTPQASDIAQLEQALSAFVDSAAKDPSLLDPFIGGNQMTRSLFAWLPAHLASLKRQYFGFAHGDTRRVVVHAIPADVTRWRSDPVFILDGGCANSWWEFSLTDRRLLRFVCGGSG